MNTFKKLNNFFFLPEDGESISVSDMTWLYGGTSLMIVMGIATLIKSL